MEEENQISMSVPAVANPLMTCNPLCGEDFAGPDPPSSSRAPCRLGGGNNNAIHQANKATIYASPASDNGIGKECSRAELVI